MSRTMLETAAQLLEGEEREVVLGDLAEAGEGAWRGVLQVLGLAARRQTDLWRNWRPWFAGFGVAMPCSFALMGVSVAISLSCRNYLGLDGASLTGRHCFDGSGLACRAVLLLFCAWSGGYVISAISRRTLWVSAVLCLSPCLFCLERFRIESLSRFCLLLFVVPAMVGARSGLRRLRMKRRFAVAVAGAITLPMIVLWTSRGPWILDWVLLLPPWYLVFSAPKSDWQD